jgi:hypothetical protein
LSWLLRGAKLAFIKSLGEVNAGFISLQIFVCAGIEKSELGF